MSSDVHTSEII